MMKLRSVNVSSPKTVSYNGQRVTTGIFKKPVSGRIMLCTLNLDGDGQGDLSVHGGIYQAVYVYPFEHYEYWARELSRGDLTFGQFGENFTIEGMPEDAVHIGDVFRVGGALVQVTQPRVPCYKLGLKMGSAQFPKQFLANGRVGYYLRVLEEGEVGAGDVIQHITIDPERMTIQQIVRLAFFDQDNVEMTKKALRLQALSPGWRAMFEERLAETGLGAAR